MNCPYCNQEMEKGVVAVDEIGIVNFIYRSEEDEGKKGLAKLKANPVPFMLNRSSKTEAYRCKACRKIAALYNETFVG